MKKVFTIILIICSQIVNAQKVKTFFEIGINHGHVKEKVFYEYDGKSNYYKPSIGFNLGLKMVAKIDERFDFKTGFYLAIYKYNTDVIGQAQLFNMDVGYHYYPKTGNAFLNIPLLLSYKINKNIALNIGSGVNNNLLNFIDKKINNYDFPLNVGFTFRIKRTTLDLMYSIGNVSFDTYYNYFDYYPSKQYSTFFHRQLSINIGRCLNRRSKTKWD